MHPMRHRAGLRTGGTARAILVLCLAMLPLLQGTPAAAEYRALPNIKVELDGQPVDVGPVVQDATAILVPLGKAIAALTRGQATPDGDDARPFRVRRGDQVLLELPTDAADTTARVLGRSIPLEDPPQRVLLPGQPEQLMMNLKVLAGLLGITADQEGDTFFLFTPEHWCAQIGLGGAVAEGRTLRNLTLLPDMGVSPPAKSLLIWVRPRERAYVQIYKLSGGKPEPLLGVNQFGRRVTHPTPPLGDPRAWSAEGNQPVRVDTRFYEAAPPEPNAPKQYGSYVALIARTPPPDGDIAGAIRAGQIKAEDWCVVGVRQRVVRAVLLYEPYTVAAGDTLASIAGQFKMPVALLEDLNGLRAADPLTAGEKVVILSGMDVGEQARREKATTVQTGYYEVKPGDTMEGLARRCGVSLDQFLEANSALPPGAELESGEIVTLLKPLQPKPVPPKTPKPPPPPQPDVQVEFKSLMTKGPTVLRQYSVSSAPVLKNLPAGLPVAVLATIPERNQCRVAVGDVIGWVPLSSVTAATVKEPPPLPVTAGQLASGQRVVAEALRWVGIPRYEWGGNNIARGIDCSHFVAAAYARSGQPCPSPPVHNMETFGSVVHWKPGPAESFGQVRGMPTSPSIASLQPGDRIIFQNNPTSARDGNHHTGIYVGAYQGMKHAVVHCNSSSNTVSVNELPGRLWRIYRYGVRGAQRRPAGQFAAAAPTRTAGKGEQP